MTSSSSIVGNAFHYYFPKSSEIIPDNRSELDSTNKYKKIAYDAKWIVLGLGAGIAVTVSFFHLVTAATIAVVAALCFAALLTFEAFDKSDSSIIFEKIFKPIREYSFRNEISTRFICLLVQGVVLSIFATLGLPACIPASIGILGFSYLTNHVMFYRKNNQ